MSTAIAVRDSSLLAMIERVATTPEMDLGKLERLIELQERVLAQQARMDYAAAMSAVQGQVGAVCRAAENTQTHSRYALLDDVLRALVPIATEHGFSLSFSAGVSPSAGERRTCCTVMHSGGHAEDYTIDLPLDGVGIAGKSNKTPIHSVKSAHTYGRSMLTQMIFNVALTGESDDDGNGATVDTITADQAAEIDDLVTRTGADRAAFLRFVGASDMASIRASKYAQAVTMLRRKLTQIQDYAPPPDIVAPAPEPEPEPEPVAKISDAQHRRLEARITRTKANRDEIKNAFGLDHLTNMTRDQYDAADRMLDAKEVHHE